MLRMYQNIFFQRIFFRLVFIAFLCFLSSCGKKVTESVELLNSSLSLPLACVIDLDGTIADETQRREEATGKNGKINWKEYFRSERVSMDVPILYGKDVLHWLLDNGVKILYLSSRPESMRKASETWLRKNGFPQSKLFLKKEKFQKTVIFKTREIKRLLKKYHILFGVGDRESDRKAYEANELNAFMIRLENQNSWLVAQKGIMEILKKNGF